jgi:hypothetical protein
LVFLKGRNLGSMSHVKQMIKSLWARFRSWVRRVRMTPAERDAESFDEVVKTVRENETKRPAINWSRVTRVRRSEGDEKFDE